MVSTYITSDKIAAVLGLVFVRVVMQFVCNSMSKIGSLYKEMPSLLTFALKLLVSWCYLLCKSASYFSNQPNHSLIHV